MISKFSRRELAVLGASATASLSITGSGISAESAPGRGASPDMRIKELRVTPIALPDPPILAASGCHGPYFLRNIIQIKTDEGITGIGETHGGAHMTDQLNKCRRIVVGRSAFAYRKFAEAMHDLSSSVYAGIELACLDAIGRALRLRSCELLGGPVRDQVQFAAYLFYRYAADHAGVLGDPRLVDNRGKGDRALDEWGEVRTPEAMAQMAMAFRRRWGFQVFKLKAGVLAPDVELRTLQAMNEQFDGKAPLRVDPNGRWTVATAAAMGRQLKDLPLEYYEDPVAGMTAMADVRRQTGLTMATNSCVTRFGHIRDAVVEKPIDVVLGDHHYWGGLTGFQTLGTVAASLGWGLSHHSNNHAGITMAAMIHAGAATPQLTYAGDTHYVWLVEGADIIQGANLPIRGGKMRIPEAPGVGVDLDCDKLARAHETYRKCGMRRRDDSTTMKRFEPGWKRTLF